MSVCGQAFTCVILGDHKDTYLYNISQLQFPDFACGFLLFHYDGILGLDVARTDRLHGLAQKRCILKADNLH